MRLFFLYIGFLLASLIAPCAVAADALHQAVELVNRRAQVEASGGITLDRVRDVASTGVDFISVGALTHSVKALDLSLEVVSL